MMQAFRNSAKPVVYLITITFLTWMIVDLSGLSGKGGVFTKTSVGSINGTSVDTRLYQQAVQNAITQRQQQSGSSLGLDEVQEVRNQVWESFIQQAVLTDEIKRNGLSITTDEVAEWIKNVPPQELQVSADFQTNGSFDLTKYQRWLVSPIGQQYIPALETQARNDLLQTKLMRNVTADIYLSDAALWERYRDQHEEVSIAVTAILPRNAVPDSAVTVSDAEAEAYFKAHPDDFKRPRHAFMSFVAVSRKLDASDSAAALEHVKALRDEIAKGTPFAEVAKRESADTLSGRNGGDLGPFGKGQMSPAFEKSAFAIPLNTISEPVGTEFGYHLIQVTKRTKDSVTARHLLVKVELNGKHRDQVDAETDSLERLAAERLDPAALDTVARALKLPIGQTGPVQESGRVVLGTYVIPNAAVWAFQAKVHETSPVIEGEVASYVFRLDSVQAAGTPTLASVRAPVEYGVRLEKKVVMARQLGATLIKRLDTGESLVDASKAMHLPNQTFPAFTRVKPPITTAILIGAAFGASKGAHSGLIDTPDGLYVLRVVDKIPADSAAFLKDQEQLRAQFVRMAKQDRLRQFLAALRADAKIKDARAELQKTNAQAEADAAAAQPTTKPKR